MDISTVIEYLNKTKGYQIDASYYNLIGVWADWWRGFYKPFHEFVELNGERRVSRKLYTMKMAKKVAEDWAAILLNEHTEIVIAHKASDEFLHKVLDENDFCAQANALVEKAFALGTGAFVLKLSGMSLEGDVIQRDDDTQIHIDYLTARQTVPLSVRNGRVIDTAFVSETMEQGKKYVYLETHELTPTGYKITNEYFSVVNDKLRPEPLPAGLVPVLYTSSDVPLFAIFGPNIVNSTPDADGMGVSVYGHALDNLMGVDLAFNNLCRDFKLGGKKVFYDQSIIRTDDYGNTITPDDVMQQLFVQVGDGLVDEQGRQKAVQEFNPDLRVESNKDGIQAQLDYLSFKCGLGTKHYQFNAGTVVTATQYMGDKQELIQNASKHYIIIERALKQLTKAILWAGKEILGQPVDPDAQVTVNFDDSYIIDKESERLRDLQEMREGIMQKWEYRMKWYGEDEATAKKMVGADQSDDELMKFAAEDEE